METYGMPRNIVVGDGRRRETRRKFQDDEEWFISCCKISLNEVEQLAQPHRD